VSWKEEEKIMTGFDKFCISVFDAIAHGPFLNEQELFEKTGYKIFEIEKMINDIKTPGTIDTGVYIKDETSGFFKMLTKALSILIKSASPYEDYVGFSREILTMLKSREPYGFFPALRLWNDYSEAQLKKILEGILRKNFTTHEYYEILK
jgi:hypothetical protein